VNRMASSEDKDRVEDQGASKNAAGRRAILKALAAAGPVIVTATPFYARAEYVGGVYQVGSVVCNPHDDRDKNKCKPKK